MFAVNPKRDCPHVFALDFAAFTRKPVDVNAECEEEGCHHSGENWICCFCGSVMCSRYISGHAAQHAEKNPDHCISVSFADCSCWCYKCDSYIDDPISIKFVREVQRAKFGLPAPETEPSSSKPVPAEVPVSPIVIGGAAAEMPDTAFRSEVGSTIEIRDIPSSGRVLIDNCSKCIIKVSTALSVLQLEKCHECTIYVDNPVQGIFIHGSVNITVRQHALTHGRSLGVRGSLGVVMIMDQDPYYVFFSSCEIVNSAVGFKTPTVSTVIAETGHAKTIFNRETRAFETVPVKDPEEDS